MTQDERAAIERLRIALDEYNEALDWRITDISTNIVDAANDLVARARFDQGAELILACVLAAGPALSALTRKDEEIARKDALIAELVAALEEAEKCASACVCEAGQHPEYFPEILGARSAVRRAKSEIGQ